jgi:hypothetical protein
MYDRQQMAILLTEYNAGPRSENVRNTWDKAKPSETYGQRVLDHFDEIRQRLYHSQPAPQPTTPPGMTPQFTNPNAPGYVDPNSPEGRAYAQREAGIGR